MMFAHQQSLEELDQLLLSKSIPQADKTKYIEPMLSFVKSLEHKDAIDITFTLPLIREGHSDTFLPLNPSIIKTDGGYDIICKTTNLKCPGYQPIIPGETPSIRNFFLRYDKNFNLLNEQKMHIPSHLTVNINDAWQVEDCRTFHWNESYWLIGCALIKPRLPKVAMQIVYQPTKHRAFGEKTNA